MNKSEKEKGSALSTVIIIILLILIAIAVFLFLKGSFGFGNGSGNGNSEAAVPANAEVSSESDSETSATTTIQTEETKYFEITVSGNEYTFQNDPYTDLDELINTITSFNEKYDVKIKNKEASKNAYDDLVDALKENGFAIIEEN